MLAQNSQKLLEEKRMKEEQKQKGRKLGAAGVMCILAAVLCLGYYSMTLWQDHLESQEFEKLQDMQNLTGHLIRETSSDEGHLSKVPTPKADVLYVGDSGIDMETARRACVESAGVTWGFRPVTELRQAYADHIVETPSTLLRLLRLAE